MVISAKVNEFEKVSQFEESQLLSSTIKLTEKKPLRKQRIMIDSGKVRCTEEHQQSNPDIFPKDRHACKWGRKNGNVKTCGDCPFGIKILEISPTHKTYLKNWEARLAQWNWSKENLHLIHPYLFFCYFC